MLSIFLAFCEVAGHNFINRSGTNNFETYEIATTDTRRRGHKLHRLRELLVLTTACGCAGTHSGGRRELWFWLFFVGFWGRMV